MATASCFAQPWKVFVATESRLVSALGPRLMQAWKVDETIQLTMCYRSVPGAEGMRPPLSLAQTLHWLPIAFPSLSSRDSGSHPFPSFGSPSTFTSHFTKIICIHCHLPSGCFPLSLECPLSLVYQCLYPPARVLREQHLCILRAGESYLSPVPALPMYLPCHKA